MTWKNLIISPESSIEDALKKLNEYREHIVLVADASLKLIGTITDGDIRRGILKGFTINQSVAHVMNSSPVSCIRGKDESISMEILKQEDIKVIPVIDENGILLDIHTSGEIDVTKEYDNPVIIMAGGKGERLIPLTTHTPKPLLKVGNKPILETILENLVYCGFSNLYFSVNYRLEDIKNYFQDGCRWGANIHYLKEKKRLGTAGCLSLFPHKPTKPIVVVNGDLLTKVDFKALLAFHEENKSAATVCVREYNYQIPYGVTNLEGIQIINIEEKPIKQMFVNAGIYILEPMFLKFVPKDTYFDMTSLLKEIMEKGHKVNSFPIHEYWLDIGQKDDFERAQKDYVLHFERENK